MTMLAPFVGNPSAGQTLLQAITAAGLTTNLQLVLDAGDSASYTSGTKWLDRSGNGYDFFLGTDGVTNAPTFTGTAGNLGDYWLNTASSLFTYDTTNETWMQNLHKNNAALTMISMINSASAIGTVSVCATMNSVVATNTGIAFEVNATTPSGKLICQVGNGTGSFALNASHTVALPDSYWHFVAVSLDESVGAGGGIFYLDGSATTFTSTYSSPSVGNATSTMTVSNPGSGSKQAMFAAWSTALSQANLDVLFARLRGRFGI